MGLKGWELSDGNGFGSWKYVRNSGGGCVYSADSAFAQGMLFFFFLPIASLILIQFYPVALFIVGLVMSAYGVRYARRFKKVFKTHVEDPDAHSKLKK